MNQQLVAKTLKFVQIASSFGKRAADELNVHRGLQTKAAALRPALLDKMVAAGTVDPGYKEAADAMLSSHPETLKLLEAAIEKIAELRNAQAVKTASDLGGADHTQPGQGGSGVSLGGASYDSLNSPVVGGRHSENVKIASDEALRQITKAPGSY